MALKIANKGWVVIPASLGQKYNLTPGTSVEIVDQGGVLALVPQHDNPIETAAGMLAGGPSLTEALMCEREQAHVHE